MKNSLPGSPRVSRKIRQTTRNQRWSDARRVIAAGLDILSHPEDKTLRSRFNQVLDQVNKQVAANVSDHELVFNAIRNGARDRARLREITLFGDDALEEALEALELSGAIRRVSRSIVEIRDRARERSLVVRYMKERGGVAVTLDELRSETGYSRRHLQQILTELRDRGKISRTRTGFLLAELSPASRIGVEHDDDCLCRQCLTPRSQLKQQK